MPQALNDIEREALGWVIQQRDPDFIDWEAFETWLVADAAHATAYHAAAALDRELGALPRTEVRPTLVASAQSPRTGRRFLIGSVAAAMVATIGGYALTLRPDPYRIETAAGVRRTVMLEGGTTIALNGGTTITLDRRKPRFARLEKGEALFAVVHDAKRPFAVIVGKDELLDVGTRFNVVRADAATTVQVAEGAVVYNPDGEAMRLGAGDTLLAADAAATVVRGHVAAGDVGTWREGRLVFDGVPLREVAAQIARYSGQNVRTTADVASRPFRGVLNLSGPIDMKALGAILGVGVRRDGDAWIFTNP